MRVSLNQSKSILSRQVLRGVLQAVGSTVNTQVLTLEQPQALTTSQLWPLPCQPRSGTCTARWAVALFPPAGHGPASMWCLCMLVPVYGLGVSLFGRKRLCLAL